MGPPTPFSVSVVGVFVTEVHEAQILYLPAEVILNSVLTCTDHARHQSLQYLVPSLSYYEHRSSVALSSSS